MRVSEYPELISTLTDNDIFYVVDYEGDSEKGQSKKISYETLKVKISSDLSDYNPSSLSDYVKKQLVVDSLSVLSAENFESTSIEDILSSILNLKKIC